ncbi:hypothetical protein OG875_23640 [Streptomyces sp. NBC_01498]|uniref:hypothetical protein n=1 Tax=Streptomyces sp. NBC_01498 TaxID=2975870 RepID=UPI002E7BE954|nr:hypothetical protein [Streptomyces sp. NBC_01498]WTL29064.1 hypothetical protein OG875_23640 [Streptomyces sp. NBC_01498]
MTEEHTDIPALVAVRLGSRKDRHWVSCSWFSKWYFTVRDRTDTDQSRRRSVDGTRVSGAG